MQSILVDTSDTIMKRSSVIYLEGHLMALCGDLDVFDSDDRAVMEVWQRRQDALRLIGLLLAAAPHLADLLDPQGTPTSDVIEHMRDAIEEAAR